MPSSSISAGKKLDTTPRTKTPITNTLSQIHKGLTVGVVRLALCDRCNSFQWNSVPFNLLSCHLVSSPMPEPFGNPDCNEIAEGKSGMNIPPNGLAVWMCLRGSISCPPCKQAPMRKTSPFGGVFNEPTIYSINERHTLQHLYRRSP